MDIEDRCNKLSVEKIDLSDISKEELGEYFVSCNTGGYQLQLQGQTHTFIKIKSYPIKIGLILSKKDNIIIIVDKKNKLIVDGRHRAVAWYQSGDICHGYLKFLSSKKDDIFVLTQHPQFRWDMIP